MRVGLDLLYLLPGETGGRETYARELVGAMLESAPELELVAFVNRDAGPQLAAELGEGVRAVVLPISARGRGQWALGELALISVSARREGVELLHCMANFAPPWGRFRRVVTIHDLQYRAVPELLSPAMRIGTSALVSLAARRAHRIIAVSAAGRDEIVAELGIDARRIDVVPNGVRPAPPAPLTAGLRERYGLDRRAIALAVATNLPHKNLPALFGALALMPAETRPVLLLAGHETDDARMAAQAAAAGVADDVRLLGARSTQELESLCARRLPRAAEPSRGLRPPRSGGDGALAARRVLGDPRAARGRTIGRALFRSALTGSNRCAARRADRRSRTPTAPWRAGPCPRAVLQLARGRRGDAC